MKEYELFTRMLSQDFLSPDQFMMEEPKQAGAHTCTIVNTGVEQFLYPIGYNKRKAIHHFGRNEEWN